MTAEIAILNKSAVALAADSAVTVGRGRDRKVYNTANKLFGISHSDPIGIMIYGSVNLNGVPWETLIKTYRQRNKKRFPSVELYARDFIKYLEDESPRLFEADSQSFQVYSIAGDLTDFLKSEYFKLSGQAFPEDGSNLNQEHLEQALEITCQRNPAAKTINDLPKEWHEKVRTEYLKDINAALEDHFEKETLSGQQIGRLVEEVFYKVTLVPIQQGGNSGIVIAGFGQDEVYPALYAFNIDHVINNRLSFSAYTDAKVSFYNGGIILPFAQDDGASSIVWGRSFEYEQSIRGFVDKMFSELPNSISGIIGAQSNLTADAKEELKTALQGASQQLNDQLWKSVTEYQNKHLREQILATIKILPKDELAAIAEAMVYITALRRKMSKETESVGGPIDVALMSKGDGFIWVKRKHYFKPELNPHFIMRYSNFGYLDPIPLGGIQ